MCSIFTSISYYSQEVIFLRDYHWYICFRAITRIWHFIQLLLMIILFHITCLYNTFARNCKENYWMFTENTEDVKFRRNHSPATMYDNSNKIIKFFMVYCIIRLGKKNTWYIAFVECIWLNTLSLELQKNNKTK